MARRSVLLLVAVIIAALGTTLIVMYVRGIDARAAEGQEMVEVLVATETIDVGETIDAAQENGKLEISRVNRAAVVPGSLDSTSSISGNVALGNIYAGEQILSQKFGAPGQADTLSIPDDKVAISVSLNDPQRVAGFVTPGAHVAVIGTYAPEVIKPGGDRVQGPEYSSVLLGNVQVIGVGTTTAIQTTVTDEEGQQTTEQVPRTILTLAVDQDQAEKVIYASIHAQLSFALLTEDSVVDEDAEGVTLDDLIPEYYETLDPALLGGEE